MRPTFFYIFLQCVVLEIASDEKIARADSAWKSLQIIVPVISYNVAMIFV